MNHHSKNLLKNMSQQELKQITERIIFLRQTTFKMTQQQFAETIKISQTYLSLIENGKKKINMDTLLQIAFSLKVNLDWLIYGKGNEIFQSKSQNQFIIAQNLQDDALLSLKSAYALKDTDIIFIRNYLSLSDRERTNMINAISSFQKLIND